MKDSSHLAGYCPVSHVLVLPYLYATECNDHGHPLLCSAVEGVESVGGVAFLLRRRRSLRTIDDYTARVHRDEVVRVFRARVWHITEKEHCPRMGRMYGESPPDKVR